MLEKNRKLNIIIFYYKLIWIDEYLWILFSVSMDIEKNLYWIFGNNKVILNFLHIRMILLWFYFLNKSSYRSKDRNTTRMLFYNSAQSGLTRKHSIDIKYYVCKNNNVYYILQLWLSMIIIEEKLK